jgi:hypothetical protein
VIVTGAFLAEAAAAVDNKLNVRGGVLDSCQVGPDRVAKVTLVVLTQAEAGDKAAKLNIEIVNPSGDSQAQQIDMPEAALGGEIGFAFFPIGIPVRTDGRYLLKVTSRGGCVALPLRVHN